MELYHYGIKRRSGRYPYGSGERPYQSTRGNHAPRKSFEELKKRYPEEPADPDNDPNLDSYVQLYKEIREKSSDWYNGEGVSSAAKS